MIFAFFDLSPLTVCINCSFFTFIVYYNVNCQYINYVDIDLLLSVCSHRAVCRHYCIKSNKQNSAKSTVLCEWNYLVQGKLSRTTGTLNSRPCRRPMMSDRLFSHL